MHNLEKLKPLALLLLRWALGLIFVYHGWPKLFGNTQQAMQGFASAGFPAWMAYVAGVVELFGGALLIAGLFTRIAGLLLAGEMVVALWKVHLGKGLLAVNEYQFPMALAAAAFALAALGAGAISFDRAIFKEKA